MGTLVAGVAHEVRNPLFATSATVDAFEAQFKNVEDFRPYMAVLRSELQRLGAEAERDWGFPSFRKSSNSMAAALWPTTRVAA